MNEPILDQSTELNEKESENNIFFSIYASLFFLLCYITHETVLQEEGYEISTPLVTLFFAAVAILFPLASNHNYNELDIKKSYKNWFASISTALPPAGAYLLSQIL